MDKTRVVIVVDPGYGHELNRLSRLHPIWIVASQVNDEATRALWKQGIGDITTFRVTEQESRVENLLEILSTVDLHQPGYNSLIVIGITRSEALDARLAASSLVNPRDGVDGFIVDVPE
jgi:hypothetical protein